MRSHYEDKMILNRGYDDFKKNLILNMKRNNLFFKRKYIVTKYNCMDNYKRVLPVGEKIHANNRFIFRNNIFFYSFFMFFNISFYLTRAKWDYNFRYYKLINYPDTFMSLEKSIDNFLFYLDKITLYFSFKFYIDENSIIKIKRIIKKNKNKKIKYKKDLLNKLNEKKIDEKWDEMIENYIK